MSFGQLTQALDPTYDEFENDAISSGQGELTENGIVTPRGEGYQFDRAMLAAVDVALELGRPLLISGEPGVGKTELGYAVARSLGIPRIYLHSVKSTSDAGELFYTYDALRRLQDSRLGNFGGDVGDYVDFQALGLAILNAHERDRICAMMRGKNKTFRSEDPAPSRSLVVIDEIDKAPKDFPNDLLHEIEVMRFGIREFPEFPQTPPLDAVPLELRPVVIITSNEERQLPDAFLRRCVFHEIPFPEPAKLRKILEVGLKHRLKRMGAVVEAPELGSDRADKLIKLIGAFREADPDKKPGIAEMLDAAALLFNSERDDLAIAKPAMVKLKRDAALFDRAVSEAT